MFNLPAGGACNAPEIGGCPLKPYVLCWEGTTLGLGSFFGGHREVCRHFANNDLPYRRQTCRWAANTAGDATAACTCSTTTATG